MKLFKDRAKVAYSSDKGFTCPAVGFIETELMAGLARA